MSAAGPKKICFKPYKPLVDTKTANPVQLWKEMSEAIDLIFADKYRELSFTKLHE